jgi:hypothetical protein
VFRVSKADERSHTLITFDGQLSSESIEIVETFCQQAMSTGKPVHLFLRDVSAVDQAGRALLCRLAGKGVRLLASGIYNSYLVRTLRQAGRKVLNCSATAEEPGDEATQ